MKVECGAVPMLPPEPRVHARPDAIEVRPDQDNNQRGKAR
jgi:hypothetical protein